MRPHLDWKDAWIMHRAVWKKSRGTLGAVVVAALTLGLISASNFGATADPLEPITRTVPSGGLNFSTANVENVEAGTVVTYTNIDGAGTIAVLELVDTVNLHSETTGTEWHLDWAEWHEENSDTVDRYAIGWRFRDRANAPWQYLGVSETPASSVTAVTDPLSNTYDNFRLTNVSETVERDNLDFSVLYREESSGPWQEIVFPSDGDSLPYLEKTSGNVGDPFVCEEGDRYHACYNEIVYLGRVESLDAIEITSSLVDGFIRLALNRDSSIGDEPVARIRISFFNSDRTIPVAFSNLEMSSYDIDNNQFIEVAGVNRDDIVVGSNISSVVAQSTSGTWRTAASDTIWRITGKDDNTTTVGEGDSQFTNPGSTAYTEGKVTISYDSVSVIELDLGLQVDESGGSFEIDLGGRVAAFISESQDLGSPNGSSSGGAIGAAVTLISPLAPARVPGTRNVSLFGTNFDKVTEVFVGGRKLKIRKQTANQIDIRLPRGLSGLVDLELRSTLNNVLSPRHFNFGGLETNQTRRAELIVGGFAPNSRVLTPRMQSRIDRWLERNSDLGTLTCTGFTSLPRRTTDVALSTNRGTTACNFSKRQRSDLETSVSQGIEDPRPGSNIRRVRLVLTQ